MITKTIKLILVSLLITLAFSLLSCDDRKASDTVAEEGLSLSFILSQPVANGRCCDVCNDTQVVPTRLNNMLEQSPAYQMFARIMQDMERVNE